MKKIAFITLHYISNYGSVLQTYATQKIFENEGLEPECINYSRENCATVFTRAKTILNNTYPNSNKIFKIAYFFYYLLSEIRRKIVFDGFLKKNINLSSPYNSLNELYDNPPKADIYCTGSDQTWNSEYNGGILPEYFLDFVPDGSPRISFSSSFGMEHIPVQEIEQTKYYLNKYSHISVREQSAKEILNTLGISKGEVVLDPTLVLPANEWRKIETASNKRRYILIFSLYKNKKLDCVAANLKRFHNFPIIRVSFSMKDIFKSNMQYLPTVGKLLSLIDNAAFIITDSFHGAAFSLNFNKNFYVVLPDKYSTRLQSMLNIFKCEDRIVDEDSDLREIKEMDYSQVNEILFEQRKKTLSFIEDSCK